MTRRIVAIALALCFIACGAWAEEPDALARLQAGNAQYVSNAQNPAPLTDDIRADTAQNGQHPYAVVVACADSRVPVEHIFSAGIGELFVIRTAGNVLDEAGLGSVEYAVGHLGVELVVVMGHTGCGAVAATLEGGAHGHIEWIAEHIAQAIGDERDAAVCEELNARHWTDVLANMESLAGARIVGAIYDITTGRVAFLE